MNNYKTNGKSPGRRERRGVAVIIGGVILTAILLSSIFAFYLTILNNDKARTSYEIQSQQDSTDKEIETFIVDRDEVVTPAGSVNVNVNNTGSIPMVVSRELVYCSDGPDCTNSGIPIDDEALAEVLNPGEYYSDTLGDDSMLAGNTYTISVISERGNIISSTTCTLQADDTCSEDSGGDGGLSEDDVEEIVTEGIVQGTGYVQLDYRAFGALFPQLAAREGINQQGWNVITSSPYSNVTGYPAFEIPYAAHVIYVEQLRNLDSSGEDLVLTRTSGMITNMGSIPPGQQSFMYICSDNESTKTANAYNEVTANKILLATPSNASRSEGWHEVYFCTDSIAQGYSSGTGYYPEHTNDQLNSILLVIRGTFSDTHSDYGQTIPYQASLPGDVGYTTFYWCLYATNTNPGSTCPNPGTASTGVQDNTLIYTADQGTMQGGLTIYAHYRSTSGALPNGNAYISWIYPDGTHKVLAENAPLVSQNVAINLPTKNSDGVTDIDCDGKSEEYFTIKATDDYDSAYGSRNVYYMTFRMTCP